MALEDLVTSRDALSKFVLSEPTDASGHNMFGIALEHQGLFQAAEQEFSNAIRLLELEKDVTKPAEKEDILNKTLCLTSNAPAKATKLKMAQINHRRVQASLGQGTSVIDETSTDAESWSFLGYAFYNQQQYDKSVKAFEKALELSTEEGKKEVLLSLCQIYFNQKNYDKAKNYVAQWYADYTRVKY
jgi:tetratricopeptide (TPR) repeat protein